MPQDSSSDASLPASSDAEEVSAQREDKNRAGRYYVNVLIKSRGWKANDVLSGYSFTTNILRMNTQELQKAIVLTENPKFMVEAFKQKNEGASKQFHREVNRLVHNYLCSVSTFADHTRNFMDKNYPGTAFYAAYKAEIQRVFNSDELCRFVRDLRNYMTHRGLPESSLSITAKPTGETATSHGVPVNLTTGAYYAKERFLTWDGWTSPARRYLLRAEDRLSLSAIFFPHFENMKRFDLWFDEAFHKHHKEDYEEMEKMRLVYLKLEQEDETRKVQQSSSA